MILVIYFCKQIFRVNIIIHSLEVNLRSHHFMNLHWTHHHHLVKAKSAAWMSVMNPLLTSLLLMVVCNSVELAQPVSLSKLYITLYVITP